MAKKVRKTREAKPGELREINLLESMDRLSRRPESRVDLQRVLSGLSSHGQIYAKHLVMSGPSSLISAAKACGLKKVELEAALEELEQKIAALRR